MDQDRADAGRAGGAVAGTRPGLVRAVVCDLDGTLLDTEAAYKAAFLASLSGFGLTLPAGAYDSLVGLPTTARRRLLPGLLGSGVNIDAFLAAYYAERTARVAGGIALKPGVERLLAWLDAREIPRAVATSASAATATRHLALAGLAGHFAIVVSRDDVRHGKPAPDSFLAAARRLAVPPHECLAIEDSPHGVAAAAASGMMVVMVPDMLAPGPETARLCVAVAASLHHVADMLGTAGREPASWDDRSRLRV